MRIPVDFRLGGRREHPTKNVCDNKILDFPRSWHLLHRKFSPAADCAEAAALLGRLGSGMKLVGDKAYDTNEILGLVAEAGGIAVIPSRSNRKEPRPIDSAAYATGCVSVMAEVRSAMAMSYDPRFERDGEVCDNPALTGNNLYGNARC